MWFGRRFENTSHITSFHFIQFYTVLSLHCLSNIHTQAQAHFVIRYLDRCIQFYAVRSYFICFKCFWFLRANWLPRMYSSQLHATYVQLFESGKPKPRRTKQKSIARAHVYVRVHVHVPMLIKDEHLIFHVAVGARIRTSLSISIAHILNWLRLHQIY